MGIIHLFDGTRDSAFGRALIPALAEMAKYRRITITPEPGSTDISGYRFVKRLEAAAYDASRHQVHHGRLAEGLLRTIDHVLPPESDLIILSEEDFFGDGPNGHPLNWAFGGAQEDTLGRKYLLLSVARLSDPATLTHVALHEMGHMYGAAPAGRSNTEENLGPHCTNVCVMEQRLTVPTMIAQARRLASRPDKFCYQCQNDLRRYALQR